MRLWLEDNHANQDSDAADHGVVTDVKDVAPVRYELYGLEPVLRDHVSVDALDNLSEASRGIYSPASAAINRWRSHQQNN